MIDSISAHERELLHSALLPQLDDILHEAGELEDVEDVEDVERMACELLVPFESTDAPPEVVGALVEAVEQSEARAGVDLLAAFARLGCGEVARAATEACESGDRSQAPRIFHPLNGGSSVKLVVGIPHPC